MRAVLASILVLAIATAGCSKSIRYRAPLAGNPEASEIEQCARMCRRASTSAEAYTTCFAACPGVEAEEWAHCEGEEDAPPVAMCTNRRSTSGGYTALGLMAGMVGLVVAGKLMEDALYPDDFGYRP